MNNYAKQAADALDRIRKNKPLVHSVTNYVVMNSTANVLLAMGASPIMAHAPEELQEITAIVSSVVVNIGTLSKPWIESMKAAGLYAKAAGKPLVLDPVGAGATNLRTGAAKEIIEASLPTVLRGNASEIMSLSPQGATTRGVDSMHSVDDAIEAARGVAASLGTTVAVTGERDLITDGSRSLIVSNGHSLMQYVTGTGCAASVIIAAFLAVEEDPVLAAAAALAFFGVVGEEAAARASLPGSFWVQVLDMLYAVTPSALEDHARITEG
jgi:hydroxyethylthiazole kinase